MYQLDEALDREINELETVLLRLTTLRLLMAAGKHRLVDRAAAELEAAMDSFEHAEEALVDVLDGAGFDSLETAVAARDVDGRPVLEQRAGLLRSLHRDVRVALATTGAAAERAAAVAANQLDGLATMPTARRRSTNPFFTED